MTTNRLDQLVAHLREGARRSLEVQNMARVGEFRVWIEANEAGFMVCGRRTLDRVTGRFNRPTTHTPGKAIYEERELVPWAAIGARSNPFLHAIDSIVARFF